MSNSPLLEWQSHPFLERPITSSLLVLFLFFLNILVWHISVTVWHTPFYYYLGMILVVVNLLPYFVVTRYQLFDEHIEVYYWFIKIQRKYTDFGCFYSDKHGMMLSTFKMPRRLDPFRGQSLRFSKTKNEVPQLVELLKEKIGKQY
ncbi:MAG TPA: hypothetical protein PLE74_09865 [Candidatus Cloacimonadota bacterium]|nr:hypothetical protein [Candidatus Cloacimonadota bacterium]